MGLPEYCATHSFKEFMDMITITCETCKKVVYVTDTDLHVPTSGEIICRTCADKRLKRRKLRAA